MRNLLYLTILLWTTAIVAVYTVTRLVGLAVESDRSGLTAWYALGAVAIAVVVVLLVADLRTTVDAVETFEGALP